MPALTVEPESISEVHEYRSLATTDAGALFRRNAYPQGRRFRRRYELRWSMARESTLDSLVSLIRQVNGGGTLTWAPPGESSADFLIVDSNTTVSRQKGMGAITLTIEEA